MITSTTLPTIMTVGLLIASGILVVKYNKARKQIIELGDTLDTMTSELKQAKEDFNTKALEANNQAADLTHAKNEIDRINAEIQDAQGKAAKVDELNVLLQEAEAKKFEFEDKYNTLVAQQGNAEEMQKNLEAAQKEAGDAKVALEAEQKKAGELTADLDKLKGELKTTKEELDKLKKPAK